MGAQAKHRESIVAAAASLFRRQGYAGTGIADILAASGAPKGSLYHYFPDGKAGIGAAAMESSGAAVTQLLRALARENPGPGALLRRYAEELARGFEDSGWLAGCPLATVLLEVAPGDTSMTRAGQVALANWCQVFEQSATGAGIPTTRAGELAALTIATVEGGLILSRVAQSAAPLLMACRSVADMFDGARAGEASRSG